MGPVVPHSPDRRATEARPKHHGRLSPVAQEHAAKRSAYNAGADKRHHSFANKNAVRPDGVSVELFEITLNARPATETASCRCLNFEGGAAAAKICHRQGTPQKEGSDRVRQLQGYLTGSAPWQDTAEDHRSPPQGVLRACRNPAG